MDTLSLVDRLRYCLILVIMGIGLFVWGCTGGSIGRMHHSADLMARYEQQQLPENMTYYYCGRDTIPYAVIGIHPDYSFESRFWFKIESREDLYYKVSNLSNFEPDQNSMVAKDILGPGKIPVGIWFSYYNTTSVKVDMENHKVWVFNPYNPGSRLTRG